MKFATFFLTSLLLATAAYAADAPKATPATPQPAAPAAVAPATPPAPAAPAAAAAAPAKQEGPMTDEQGTAIFNNQKAQVDALIADNNNQNTLNAMRNIILQQTQLLILQQKAIDKLKFGK